eukprot:UC1_evm1s413
MCQLRAAGICLWVLTGDKLETAVNISLTSGHVAPDAARLMAVGLTDADTCTGSLQAHRTFCLRAHGEQDNTSPDIYEDWLMVDDGGENLRTVDTASISEAGNFSCDIGVISALSQREEARGHSQSLASPSHSHRSDSTVQAPLTLAVGDGANDVAMIQEAHIGVGILGKEGRQAARASDFSIGRFEVLQRMILVHGHQFYARISYSVHYFFYKAIVFALPLFLFGFYTRFSSQTLFEDWLLTFY